MPEHEDIARMNSHLTKLHAAEHTDGTDDIQNATGSVKGLATAAQITKLNGIATGATDDSALTTHINDTTDAHDASAISYAGGTGMSATDAEAAIDELATEKANASDLTAHTGDTSDAHDASAISFVPAGTIAATDVQAAIEEVASEAGGGGGSDDQTAAEVPFTPTGAIAATNVQTALAELDTEKATTGSVTTVQTNLDNHTGDTTDAHDASAISVLDAATQYTATNVEDALAEVLDGLQAHEADSSDAHDASAISFSPTGTIAATDVQAAIAEVASEAAGGSGRTPTHTVSSDVANATTSFADITDLTHSVVSGTTYRFYALIVYATSLSTVGASFSYNGPTTTFQSHKAVWGGTSNTVQTQTDAQAYDVNNVSTAHGQQGFYTATIEGIVKPNASGTLAMRFKSDGDGTITVKAGSTLEIW